MEIIIVPLLRVLTFVLNLYAWAIIGMVILSWLTAFNILNGYNRAVFVITTFLFKITEPFLRHIRRLVPTLAGIDLSPLVAILILWFFQEVLFQLSLKFFKG